MPASASNRRLSLQNRIAVGLLLAAALAAVAIIVIANLRAGGEPAGADATQAQVVRDDSHRLHEAPEEKAVLVEFLDFECEACLAAHPLVEELIAEHGENLTVVSRYFPLPGHPNSGTSAAAVEAAAQQGQFQQMHALMFEKQTEWSHNAESQAETFRGYASSLGLDMTAYDAAIADPATMERINADKNDGVALDVQGTPTFFLEGRLIQPSSTEEFRSLIEAAVRD
ncbi:thioredoxin domain-containing protein [Arthrobacter sp. Helios]|uniref:DsbA family protein n=1 Tax=Arthrobacter sp. Helios TaxID=2828862 RepID=UPI002061D0E5|nr:thioredoxin domain-containing protein [Arthrobacter sp. Helios]UPO78019.1 DsbA family protein [Arthrobacter sp. Helios]